MESFSLPLWHATGKLMIKSTMSCAFKYLNWFQGKEWHKNKLPLPFLAFLLIYLLQIENLRPELCYQVDSTHCHPVYKLPLRSVILMIKYISVFLLVIDIYTVFWTSGRHPCESRQSRCNIIWEDFWRKESYF